MSTLVIKGDIVCPDKVKAGVVRVEGGIITEILSGDEACGGAFDYSGMLVLPGFIDVHMHAIQQHDVFEADDLVKIAEIQSQFGGTGFLPTVANITTERYLKFGNNVRKAQQAAAKGAKILGAHFEGPFINPAKKGGMNEEFLLAMDTAICRSFINEVGDVMKLMTLSPELEGAGEVIRLLRENGTVVSLGHSTADAEDLAAAIEAGLSHVCHMYDTFEPGGMLEGWQWQPGLMEEILLRDELTGEVICDMQHVLPQYVKLTARLLGPDRFVAITDSLRGAGDEAGEYHLVDGREFSTRSGLARLTSNNDVVGSVLTMNQAFGNLVDVCGIDPVMAARFTATNPARAIGMDQEIGSIEPGKWADLTVLDASSNCVATFVNGVKVYGN